MLGRIARDIVAQNILIGAFSARSRLMGHPLRTAAIAASGYHAVCRPAIGTAWIGSPRHTLRLATTFAVRCAAQAAPEGAAGIDDLAWLWRLGGGGF